MPRFVRPDGLEPQRLDLPAGYRRKLAQVALDLGLNSSVAARLLIVEAIDNFDPKSIFVPAKPDVQPAPRKKAETPKSIATSDI